MAMARDRMAQLLNGLDAYGVNLKVVDVLFDGEQNPAQDPSWLKPQGKYIRPRQQQSPHRYFSALCP
jgi:hypothetical protein